MSNPLFDAILAPHLGSEAPFITYPDGDVVTYGSFLDKVGATSNALIALGLQADDRLAVQMEKSVLMLEIYCACLASGIVFVPFDETIPPEQLQVLLRHSDPALLIYDPRTVRQSGEVAHRCNIPTRTLSPNGHDSFADEIVRQEVTFIPAERADFDLAAIVYTSGTTGHPKGAMISQENLLSNALVLKKLWQFTSADKLLHALPMFHAHGLFLAVNVPLLAGAQIIFLRDFDQHTALSSLRYATVMMGVPKFYDRLLDHASLAPRSIPKMRLFLSGYAPLSPDTHRKFQALTGHRVIESYDMTEAGTIASNLCHGEYRSGSIGRSVPGAEVRIMRENGNEETRPGKAGEIWVRGPSVFSGYWCPQNPAAKPLHANGFFATGDRGKRDADGFVYILDRSVDLIRTGGFTVHPSEVEALVSDVSWVREAAVIGIPDREGVNSVVAVLTIASGQASNIEELRAELASKLAKYKQPKAYIIAQALPRTTMGNVAKSALRAQYIATFSTQAAG